MRFAKTKRAVVWSSFWGFVIGNYLIMLLGSGPFQPDRMGRAGPHRERCRPAVTWLLFFGIFVPGVTAIMMVDYFLRHRSKYPDKDKIKVYLILSVIFTVQVFDENAPSASDYYISPGETAGKQVIFRLLAKCRPAPSASSGRAGVF